MGRLARVNASDATASVQEALERFVDAEHLPGYVAGVSLAGETALCAGGTLALGYDESMAADTVFRIASLSKPVGGVLALTLIQDGTIALGADVGRWLPELAEPRVLRTHGAQLDDTVPARRPILVEDLLTMTAGFGLLTGDSPLRAAMIANGLMPGPFAPPFSHDEFMARLGALPLECQPGDRWLYHTSADVLAVLIARASGRSCGQLLRERIAGPLEMTDTRFYAAAIERVATAYTPTASGLELLDPPAGAFSRQPDFEALGSGLVSTVPDYLAFQTMLLDGGTPILSPSSVQLFSGDRLDGLQRTSAQSFLGPGRSWGLMVEVELDENDSEVGPGSFGWMGGTGTTAYVDPSRELCGALFTQRAMESNRPTEVFRTFWRAVYGLSQ
jgi:CubicO group peptidase (beta-lactamase class C family)